MNMTINLTLDQLNYIISVLAKQPYDSVVDLIATLRIQGEAQLNSANSAVAEDSTEDSDKSK